MAPLFVTGDSELVVELLEAFDLGEMTGVTSFSINVVAGEVVTATFTKLVTSDELRKVVSAVGARNVQLLNAGGIAITGNLVEQGVPEDPGREMRELAELLKKSTKDGVFVCK